MHNLVGYRERSRLKLLERQSKLREASNVERRATNFTSMRFRLAYNPIFHLP